MAFGLQMRITFTLLLLAFGPDGRYARRVVSDAKSGQFSRKFSETAAFQESGKLRALSWDDHSDKSSDFIDLGGTASFITLIEEILTNTKFTVPITFERQGLIQRAKFTDVLVVNTTVGPDSRIETSGKSVELVLTDVELFVQANLDMELLGGIRVPGTCEAVLFGGGIALSMPMKKYPGSGGCAFSKDFDMKLVSLDSSSKLGKVANPAVNLNLVAIRRQLVAGMEGGICRALLQTRSHKTAETHVDSAKDIGLFSLLACALLIICFICGIFCCGWFSAKYYLQL